MNTDFGLKPHHIEEIRAILSKYPEVERAIIFGSRAKGTHKRGSDVDIAVIGEKISLHTLLSLMADFEESNLHFFVDVVDFKKITNKKLRKEIEESGIKIEI